MEKQNSDERYWDVEVENAFAAISALSLVNSYTNENVVLGRIKIGEEVPLNQYLEDLRIRIIPSSVDVSVFEGAYISCRRVAPKDFDVCCFELYKDKVEGICYKIPADESEDYPYDDIDRYKYGWYEYVKSLYPIFEEIIKTEVEPDFIDAKHEISDFRALNDSTLKVSEFILAIRFRSLQRGRYVNQYFKDVIYIPPAVRRLLTIRKGKYYLKNRNINSLDYKLAFLSCLCFFNVDNAKLFELKMSKWEELNYKA